jgi:ribosomal-protein-alanine N-acetyltransferase
MLRLWIFKKDDPSKVIGTIALDNIIRGPFLSCFLGYRLDRDNINQGYTTEALGELIRIAFEDMGLHRLEANIMPRNQRSLRVVEKLGFVDEGLSRDYLKINEKWEDHIHMVLLNKDL